MITDELINGLIPAELAAKSVAAEEVARFTRRSIPLTAMLIAAARRDNFKNDYEGWMQWCADRMGVTKADKRCHLDNIGRMLLMIQQTRHQAVFRLLFEMDSEKLLAITRLVKGTAATAEDVAEVISFANRFGSDLQEMSRDRIRLYVKQWLGLTQADGEGEFAEAAEKPAQMMLPGFERSIELFRDLTPETARVMVKTAEVADKTAYAGMLLVDSYVNYVQQHAGHADRETLAGLKAQLLDLVDQIDNLEENNAEGGMRKAEENNAEGGRRKAEENNTEGEREKGKEEREEADVPEIAACGNEDPENEAEYMPENDPYSMDFTQNPLPHAATDTRAKIKEKKGKGEENREGEWSPETLTPEKRQKITEQMGYDFDIGSALTQ